ncbi:MAG: FecR domain-containing protein [Bacteroidota bacterium]
MNKEEFLELAIKILGNEATREEYEHFRKCLEKKEYADEFETITKKWEGAVNNLKGIEFDVNEGFEKFLYQTIEFQQKVTPQKKQFKIYSLFQNSMFVRAAASTAFVFIISTVVLYYLGIFNGKSVSIAWNEKVTQLGEKSTLTFLDGTKIILNADSKLKYPTGFSGTREVYLEGEAYFEVAHMDNSPFIVRSGSISTEVLGTKFNVKAFPGENDIAVSLVEGKIKVSIKNDGENLLSPKQQLTYNKISNKEEVDTFDIMQVIGWKDNILIFDDVSLDKALTVLERLYGVKFELADKSSKELTIKANFENASFWTIVKVIKSLTELEYKTEFKNDELQKIIFYKK